MRAVPPRLRKVLGLVAGAVLVVTLIPATQVQSAAADPTPPSTIDFSADKTAFAAGQSVHLTAKTDVSVEGSGSSVKIIDQSTNSVVASCTTGRTCRATVTFSTGDPRTYIAEVGSLQSATIDLSRADWAVQLTADSPTVDAGKSTRLLATANQSASNTSGAYAIYIFDVTAGAIVATCATGRTCSTPTPDLFLGDDHAHQFVAQVAAVGTPLTPGDTTDVQASSEMVTVERSPWQMSLTTDIASVSAGDLVHITATTNQNVGSTDDKYVTYIFDLANGTLISSCTTGITCKKSLRWTGAEPSLVLGAFVAAPGTPVTPSDLVDIQTGSNVVWVDVDPWDVSLQSSAAEAGAGDHYTVTATVDQSVGKSNGTLAIYIFEAVNNTILKVCTNGTTCSATDRFYKATDDPYAGHVYWAWVADYVPGALSYEDVTGTRAGSDTVRVDRMPWEVHMSTVGFTGVALDPDSGTTGFHYEFDVETNQSVSKTSGQLAVYLFNGDTLQMEDSCRYGPRCVVRTRTLSESGYFALVAAATDPADTDAAINVQAGDGVAFATASELPVTGPTLENESTGGSNPSEKACQCAHADPVNTATGEFFDSATDLDLPGIGPALAIRRNYSSVSATVDGPFGPGWTTSFDASLRATIPGTSAHPLPRQVEIVQENGATVLFTRTGASKYKALPRVRAELSYNASSTSWIFTRQKTQTLTFSSAGKLTSVKDPNGNTLAVIRDAGGHVTQLTASGGRSITLTWTGNHIAGTSDSAGRAVAYTYADGLLTAVTGVDGGTTRFGYDSHKLLTSVVTPGGSETTNAYDSYNRVVSQTDPLGRTTEFAYDHAPSESDEFSTTTTTAPDGAKTVEQYISGLMVSQTRAAGTPVEATTTFVYDAALNLISTTDPGGAETTSTYDSSGNLLSQTDPIERTTSLAYDLLGRVTTVTDGLGRVTLLSYDTKGNLLSRRTPSGQTQQWSYNSDGTANTATDASGAVTSYTYSAAGQLLTATDPDGRVSSLTYNGFGTVVTSTNAAGKSGQISVDAAGRIVTVTDPLGHETTVTYDADGRLVSTTDAGGATTSTAFDAAGQTTSTTDANGIETHYTYDAAGRVSSLEFSTGATTTYDYNPLGQLVSTTDGNGRVTSFEYDLAGNLTGTTAPSGATTSAAYDAAGQQISVTDATAETTTAAFDDAGQVAMSTDPLNRQTEISYTADGQIQSVTLPDNSTELFTYDANGNLLTQTNPDGGVTTYVYDASGLLSSQTLPGGLTTTYNYDAAGRLFTTTLPDLSTSERYYDDANRLIRVHYSTSGSVDTTYTYDSVGRRSSMTDATGTSNYSYDASGQLLSQTDGAGRAVAYAYDALGRRTQLTYPGGDSVAYSYDATGQMTSVTDWDGNTTSFDWTVDGQLASRSDPNGVATTATYDAAGHTTDLAVHSGAASILDLAYTYDAAGQMASASETGSASMSLDKEYTYDSLGQVQSTGGASAYSATSAGLLTATASGAALTYNTAQQVTSLTPSSGPASAFTFDTNGRRVSAATGSDASTYSYDWNGALHTLHTPTADVSYTVDGDGLRRSRDTGTGAEQFTWDVGSSIPLLLDDGENRYIYGPSWVPIAQVDDTTGSIEYLYGDVIGSTRVVASETGAILGAVGFDEFGSPLAGSAVVSRIGFAGSWTEPVSGLLYLRARDYDPGTGQFMQVDPAVATTGQPYAYAGNNPLLNVDPLGLDWWSEVLDNVVAFGAGALDELTGGLSGAVFAATIPGYDCFVKDHQDAYTAGKIVAVVTEVVVAVATVIVTAGVAAPAVIGAAVGKLALKQGVKAGVKAFEHGVEKSVSQQAEKGLLKGVEKECNSFTADTPVLMADGTTKPIEDVAVGDQVKATDPETGTSAAEPVAALIRHSGDHAMADIALADGTTIHATAGHPFWDATTHAFVNASDLTVGDQVLTANGGLLAVTGVYRHQQDLTAYNLTITDIHTYYAGDAEVLVHNTGGACNLDGLSTAGRRPVGNQGLTAAGQELEKHSGGLFPGGHLGSASQKSEIGQNILDDILTSPGTRSALISGGRFKGGTVFIDPLGRGAAFDVAGIFRYFGEYR